MDTQKNMKKLFLAEMIYQTGIKDHNSSENRRLVILENPHPCPFERDPSFT